MLLQMHLKPLASTAYALGTRLQDDIFKPNHYLSLMEFRQLTLERLQKFVAQRYFITKDYLDGEATPVTSPMSS